MSGDVFGACGLCGRDLISGPSINKHHLVPKTFGGRDPLWIHRVCHSKIHSVFTERELLRHYHTFDRLLAHQEIIKFVKWIRKKPADFYTRNRTANEKKKKRKKRN